MIPDWGEDVTMDWLRRGFGAHEREETEDEDINVPLKPSRRGIAGGSPPHRWHLCMHFMYHRLPFHAVLSSCPALTACALTECAQRQSAGAHGDDCLPRDVCRALWRLCRESCLALVLDLLRLHRFRLQSPSLVIRGGSAERASLCGLQ